MKPLISLIALVSLAPLLIAENWPRFRGLTGQGISGETGVPTEWSSTSNMAWKTEVPGEGWSSPIVWDDRVFVTTATENGVSCRVLCLNRKSGEVLWNREVFKQTLKRKEGKNSYATSTLATDGKSVFAVFGDGSFAALDFAGQVLWTNRSYPFYSQHGLGASPVLFEEFVIMPFDASSEGDDKSIGWQKPWDRSFVVALDKQTGKERWKTMRGQSRIAHGTPIFIRDGDRVLMLSNAGDVVQGFDPRRGQLLWTIPAQGEGVVPSLSAGDGFVFSSSGFEKSTIRGIRLKPEPKIAWEQTKGVPHLPSFIYASPHLFSITEGGVAMCQKGETGEIVWQERVGGTHSASPVLAEGRIYFTSEKAETTVIEAAPRFKVLARSSLDEKCQASMAVSNGQIFLRTEKHLYCIGAKP